MTQQNAAMVEESTAASRSLASEAEALSDLVSRFALSSRGSVSNVVAWQSPAAAAFQKRASR